MLPRHSLHSRINVAIPLSSAHAHHRKRRVFLYYVGYANDKTAFFELHAFGSGDLGSVGPLRSLRVIPLCSCWELL
jgi:hypothetical protein